MKATSTYNFSLAKESDDTKADYYNKDAAHKRQATLNEQIDAFFAGGGEVTKLPAYDADRSPGLDRTPGA